MTLPSSGALSLSQIQSEFGGSNPINLSEYYRGGSLVPAHGNTTGIPSSGQISVSQFYGKSNTAPIDNAFSGTIGQTSPAPNKYGVVRRGASRSNSPVLFTNTPSTYGSFSDNTFTNPAGTVTLTIDQFWFQTDTLNPNGRSLTFSLVGNYTGQTWAQATGRTGVTVAGITQSLTTSIDFLGNASTPTFSVMGSISYITAGNNSTTSVPGTGGFSATVY